MQRKRKERADESVHKTEKRSNELYPYLCKLERRRGVVQSTCLRHSRGYQGRDKRMDELPSAGTCALETDQMDRMDGWDGLQVRPVTW